VCSFSGTNVTAHLSYATNGTYIPDSAAYIYSQYLSGGNSGPQLATYGRPGIDPAKAPTAGNIAALEALGQLLGETTPCPA
jgi:hypothetical protein